MLNGDRLTMSTMLCDDGLLKVEHEEALGVNQTDYIFRRVVEEKQLTKIKVCIERYVLKFETNVRIFHTPIDFIFWKRRT